MKTLFLSVIAAFFSLGAMAQGSRYFNYDRDQVSSAMEGINESTVTSAGSGLNVLFSADTTVSRKKYFWYGVLGGGIGCVAGVGSAYLFGEVLDLGTTAGWVGMATGAVLGTVIPAAVIGCKTRDPKSSGAAVLGSLTTLGVSALLLLALFAIGGD